ncbi:MAG: efflux RND transporter periplasmic adaptor subunit [Geopsychrobacter sp.]|nr:efflux RND transporter periplasmic adaptor subunit [Geopsychrobacter sp.]
MAFKQQQNPKKNLPFPAIIIAIGLVLLAIVLVAYFVDKPSSSTEATTDNTQEVLFWRSPMNPTEIYNAPGKDRMGMDLVPVLPGEENSGPPGTIKIDSATIQNIGVKTALIKRQPLLREIRTIGQITYDEKKLRRISPKFGGWIEQQYVNFDGQTVKKGQKLLDIYSPELVATQEEYLVALKYFDRLKENQAWNVAAGAKSLLQAAESRLRYWDISAAQLKALRLRGKITRTMSLYAPFKGIIVKKHIPEGGHVQPGQTLYEIAELSNIWVLADVYEYEAPWLELGQDAEMTLAYQPGSSFHGKVTYVYPYLKNKTRTLQVRMEFKNTPTFRFKPGMWANVILRAEISSAALTVPVQAVIRTGKRDITLVALAGGHFAPRELRLGAQSGDDFEVLSGLEEGEYVVTSAQFLINSESSLQSALSKMLPTPTEQKPTGQKASQQPAKEGDMSGMKMKMPKSDEESPSMPRQQKGE